MPISMLLPHFIFLSSPGTIENDRHSALRFRTGVSSPTSSRRHERSVGSGARSGDVCSGFPRVLRTLHHPTHRSVAGGENNRGVACGGRAFLQLTRCSVSRTHGWSFAVVQDGGTWPGANRPHHRTTALHALGVHSLDGGTSFRPLKKGGSAATSCPRARTVKAGPGLRALGQRVEPGAASFSAYRPARSRRRRPKRDPTEESR
jgi:hypothetical protein